MPYGYSWSECDSHCSNRDCDHFDSKANAMHLRDFPIDEQPINFSSFKIPRDSTVAQLHGLYFFRLYDEWFHWTRFSTNFARPIKENNATTVRNKLWIKLHLNSRLNIQLHNPFVCWKWKTYILSVYLKITKMIPIKMLDIGQFGRSGRIFPAKFISNK